MVLLPSATYSKVTARRKLARLPGGHSHQLCRHRRLHLKASPRLLKAAGASVGDLEPEQSALQGQLDVRGLAGAVQAPEHCISYSGKQETGLLAEADQSGLRAEHQLLFSLQAELAAARREAETLRHEAAAAAVLRSELAARTACLAATKDLLLRLEAQRTDELQVSMARYAELEEALAQAEQSIEHVVDEQLVRELEARVARLEAEVEATSAHANTLEQQLRQAQQGRESAEHAQREAMAQATELQQQADALGRQLANSMGEAAYQLRQPAAAEGSLRVEAELEAARREGGALQEALQSMRVEIEAYLTAAGRGGRDAALHRNRARKLQAQLSLHLLRAEAAAGRIVELEAAAKQQAAALGPGVDPALALPPASALVAQKEAQQKEALAKAFSRLKHLERDVQRARDDCDNANLALARAMRGQHAAEQAQHAAQEQLAQQAAKLSALEQALSEQAAVAESSMNRERQLEGRLAQRARLADEAAKRAQQLARQLREFKQQAAVSADQAAVVQGQLEEATARACLAEKPAALRIEWSRAEEAARRADVAEAQLVQCKTAAQEDSRQATARAQRLRARLGEEKAQSMQLEGELAGLRREYERAERDLQALTMQLQRAQQQQERTALQFTGARDEMAAVQAQLVHAMAEVEVLRQADGQKAAQLMQANKDSQALTGEVQRLAEAIADKDAALLRWRQEAEEATQLAQAAVEAQETAIGVAEKLQEELALTNREREGQQVTVAALRTRVKDAQAESQAVRADLEATWQMVESTDLANECLQEQAEWEIAAVHEAIRAPREAAQKMTAQLTALVREKEKHVVAVTGSSGGQAAPGQDRQQAADRAPPGQDFVPAHEVVELLEELDTLQSQLGAAKIHADVATAHAQAAEQRAGTLQAQLDLAAGRAAEAEGRLVELQGRLEVALVKAEAADVGVGRRMRGLMQELASAKTAAKAAEAAAEKLAGEKAALLQELAFGHGAAKRAPGAASLHTPRLSGSNANSALMTWRSKNCIPKP